MALTNDEQSRELPAVIRLLGHSDAHEAYELVGTMEGFVLVKTDSGASCSNRNLVRRFCASIVGSLQVLGCDKGNADERFNVVTCRIVLLPDDRFEI